MKRLIQTYALAILLGAAGAPALAQTTPAGVADPHAPVPAAQARPAIDYATEPAPAASPDRAWRDANATVGGRNPMRLTMPGMDKHGHDHHAGMETGAQECMAGGDQGGCGGAQGMQCMAGGAGKKGCCAGMHGKAMQRMPCMQADGTCSCCAGMHGKAMQRMPCTQADGTCGCCAGMHGKDMQRMPCTQADGTCGCCAGMKKDGCCCDHKEAT